MYFAHFLALLRLFEIIVLMTGWKHFPLWDVRPEGTKKFTEKERGELELVISLQTATLLAQHAVADQVEVDNGINDSVNESQSFYTLAVEPFLLEDDGELVIQQAPLLNGIVDISEGLHCIDRNDDEGKCVLQFAVWDPDIDTEHRIQDMYGRPVELEMIQELYEALAVCTFTAANIGIPNDVPYDTTAYPIAVIEPEIQIIADRFYD